MVTGFNTNVQYRGLVFHVQTEDCARRSLICTFVFNAGRVVATTDSSYADLTRSHALDDRELSRRLEDQHWTLVTRLREGELSLQMDVEGHAPVVETPKAEEAHPGVKSGLAALDRRIERLRALADKMVEEETARSESRRRAAERARQRRVFTPLRALGAIGLVAVGWTIRSQMNRASPSEVAVLDSPPWSGPTTPGEEPVDVAEPVAVEEAVAELPVEMVEAKPVAPPWTAGDATEPARLAPARPPPTTDPEIEQKPPPDVVAPENLAELPEQDPDAPASFEAGPEPPEPVPKLVEQPTLPDPTPPPQLLPEPEDWTGKLVQLADVDVPPRATQRELPRYTRRARRKKQHGSVELNLLVNEHGSVAEVRLLKTIPDSDLNKATLEIARLWQFLPARKESYPVRVWKPVTIDFSIVSGATRVLVAEQ